MPDFSLLDLSAETLASSYRAGELSPVEVAEAAVARQEALEPTLHAFFTVTPELALQQAAESAARFAAGQPIGPLDGVPYSIKDLEPTAGLRTTYGSAVTKDFVPDFDSVTASRLRTSGGVLLGKTTAPHYGYKDSPENLIQEPTHNPWKIGRNPGGSSSGAAASVMARYSPIAQGSDGAGSIRIPSALCGAVGFKPTIGRVPVWPTSNLWGTTVHNGPITRSVRDAALLLDVLAGPHPHDPLSDFPLPEGGYHGGLVRDGEHARGRKLLFTLDFGYGAVHAEVARAVTDAVGALRSDGHLVDERAPGWDDPGPILDIMWSAAFAAGFGPDLDAHPELIDPGLTEIILHGRERTAMDIFAYLAARSALTAAVDDLFGEYDYIVCPTMPLPAWELLTYPTVVEGQESQGFLRRSFLVHVFNFTGHPAITVPAGLSSEGLPIGLQIIGRRQDDLGVLRMAAQAERLIDFSGLPEVLA